MGNDYLVEPWEIEDLKEAIVSINSRLYEERDGYNEYEFELISKNMDAAYEALLNISLLI